MSWVAVGVAAVGTIGGMISRGKSNKKMQGISDKVNAMQINPEYGKQLGLAQTQLQGRMAGASQAEQNINQQAANTQANINRGATDPNQAILGAGAIQGQTSQAFNQLAGQDQADYANRLQRYMQAGMNKAQAEDQLRMEKLQMTTGIAGAQAANTAKSWSDVTSTGLAGATAVNSWYGKGGGGAKA